MFANVGCLLTLANRDLTMELFSVKVSPLHPDLSGLYQQLDIHEHSFNSERKAIQALRKITPDLVVADFIYGYGNNYAGVNVSNLDVLLYSLQKSAPHAKVFLLCEKTEIEYTEKLPEVVTIQSQYLYPLNQNIFREDLAAVLNDLAT